LGYALTAAVPLESLLESAATKWPDRAAIDFYDRTFTFRELHDLAARAAKGLQALGVEPRVHVGLQLPNTPHFVICFKLARWFKPPVRKPRERKHLTQKLSCFDRNGSSLEPFFFTKSSAKEVVV
jgi:non-ribosomal peptide synthetase component E (peptide arylation enzyme)